MEQPEAYV